VRRDTFKPAHRTEANLNQPHAMKLKEIIKRAHKFSKPFRVTDGDKFRLKDIDPGETLGYGSEDKPRAKEALQTGVEALAEL